jgi:hypothetical protein
MYAIEDHGDYFMRKRNVTNKLRLSYLQKVAAAFRMLCNGVVADTIDKYVFIEESTIIESLRRHI